MRPTVDRQLSVVGPVAAVVGVTVAAVLRLISGPRMIPVDLDVYLRGAAALANGEPLYDALAHDLPFTYPPFSAVLFRPLTLLDANGARLAFSAGSLLAFLVVVLVVGRALRLRPRGIVLLAAAGAVSEPLIRTVVLGQVNLYLIAFVVVDVLVLPRRWRGWLVGLAAGTKILPGVFVVYFLLRRDWTAALRAAAAFLATVAVGFLAAPRDSWAFWTGGILGLGRFGDAAVLGSDNQSLTGVLMRATRDLGPAWALTVGLALASLGLAGVVAWRLLNAGDSVAALVALAIGGLLASPVSWTHHWMWVVPALGVLAGRGWWVSALGVGAIFVLGPMWALDSGPYRELLFGPAEQVVAGSYVIAGVAVLARLAWATRTGSRHQPDRRPDADQPTGRTATHRQPELVA